MLIKMQPPDNDSISPGVEVTWIRKVAMRIPNINCLKRAEMVMIGLLVIIIYLVLNKRVTDYTKPFFVESKRSSWVLKSSTNHSNDKRIKLPISNSSKIAKSNLKAKSSVLKQTLLNPNKSTTVLPKGARNSRKSTVLSIQGALVTNYISIPKLTDTANKSKTVTNSSSTAKPSTLSKSNKHKKLKMIVWYNMEVSRYWNSSIRRTIKCGNYSCTLSHRREDRQAADAWLINAFYLKRNEKPPPRHRRDQMWVFFTREPNNNLDRMKWPKNYWKSAFNWTMSYRKDSDFENQYSYVRERPIQKKNWMGMAQQKNMSVAWMVSHCKTLSRREEYVDRLIKSGVKVDIFGTCGNSSCPFGQEASCLGNYKFYLSFENAFCLDYVTEKLFRTFRYDIVPIVRGAVDYDKAYPSGLAINTQNFKTPEELAKRLLGLENNIVEYSELLKARSRFFATHKDTKCELCQKLYEQPNKSWYPDISEWLDKGKCQPPSDL